MSGGVDSSVAAHLLVEQGHDVIGVFMRHGEQSPVACGAGRAARSRGIRLRSRSLAPRLDHKQGCCTATDAEDARRVADKLGIPFYALNLAGRVRARSSTTSWPSTRPAARRTPACSATTGSSSASCSTTRIAWGPSSSPRGTTPGWKRAPMATTALLRGIDAAKDQSYVLFGIRRELLPRMMLPVGGFEKPAIRRIAAGLGLRVAEKKDSQEICFVTRGRYDEFVRSRGVGRRSGRAGDDGWHGRRRARRHRRLYGRPAEGAGRGARRSEVRRADRAG